MGSRKRSARAREVAEFKAGLGMGLDGMDHLFAREQQRRDQMAEQHEEALRQKACESKNRYVSHDEAMGALRWSEAHGAPHLQIYRCPYCKGWHLTSHPRKP